jgi:cytochrome P450
LVHAFEKYLQAGHEKHASHVIRATIDIMRNHDVNPQDLARVETFNTSVATVNTTPTAVWMIINVLANKKLHKALSAELHGITTELPNERDASGRRIEVDISRVSKECPLLQATYQEALRLGSIPVCNRSVLEDTVMVEPETGQEVVLKKGHRVVVPTFMLHMREALWGEKAEAFDPWRFLNEKNSEDRKIRSQAFVPYGGGVHLCPGRHFAEIEILAVASLMILGMEVQMADSSEITVPRAAITSGALKPAVPMLVRMGRHAGFKDVEWVIKA